MSYRIQLNWSEDSSLEPGNSLQSDMGYRIKLNSLDLYVKTAQHFYPQSYLTHPWGDIYVYRLAQGSSFILLYMDNKFSQLAQFF